MQMMKSVCFAPMRHQVGRHNFHHECCICPANEKYFGDCSGTCIDVPLGVNQWGSNQTAIGMERGWFRTSNASLDIRECSNKEQCNGGSDPQKGCSLGATVCTDGFLVSSVGTTSITCVPCNTSGGDASFAQSDWMDREPPFSAHFDLYLLHPFDRARWCWKRRASGRLAFLFANYEPDCWSFEVFESLRRLILTGGQVFLEAVHKMLSTIVLLMPRSASRWTSLTRTGTTSCCSTTRWWACSAVVMACRRCLASCKYSLAED